MFLIQILFNGLTLFVGVCKITIMMYRNAFLSLIFGFFVVGGVIPHDAQAYVDRDSAVVRIMDKTAGKVQTITLPVNQVAKYEKLEMVVRSCKQTDPFDAEDFFMFIEISKYGEGKIFSGWMSANEPGDNPLQNADYDVWLVRCVQSSELETSENN